MGEIKKLRHKKAFLILGIIFLIILILSAAFFAYASVYYKADASALEMLSEDKTITRDGNLTILYPPLPAKEAIIFYPGAKVESKAYIPLLNKIRQKGILCILVDMPLRMAIFDINAAQRIFPKFPEIKHWYMAGHSMGGAMASDFAAKHVDDIDGLILLGAYVYGNYSLENTLTIYGSRDGLVAEDIDYTVNTVVIEGGNHAQFGNYGVQKGDLPATISAEEQQERTVLEIKKFIFQEE